MIITVIGLGYVGSTLAVLLAKQHDVFVLDKNEERVDAVKAHHSPIGDAIMEEMLQSGNLQLTAPAEPEEALAEADYVVLAVDTPLDPETGRLDTSSIERAMGRITEILGNKPPDTADPQQLPGAGSGNPVIVIKSTVPIGYTKELALRFPAFTFLFCPEFLREKTAMKDVLNPGRVIMGFDAEDPCGEEAAARFAAAAGVCFEKKDVPVLYTDTSEAEAIKLFSNSYLALRVAFFNELDTLASVRGFDAERIIKGVCMDPRIGDWYNVPGPGFGGNCLPKDTRQLIADFDSSQVPELLIRAALEENELRKEFVREQEE